MIRARRGTGDTIFFDQDCIITLTQGTLFLNDTSNGGRFDHLTIDGTGHTVIVDGGCTANCGQRGSHWWRDGHLDHRGDDESDRPDDPEWHGGGNELVAGGGIENPCCFNTLTLTNVHVRRTGRLNTAAASQPGPR